jgi:dihydropyrimidinase
MHDNFTCNDVRVWQSLMDFESVIQGGTIVTASDTYKADIGIANGRIVAIGADIEPHSAHVFSARGQYVVPGAVDVHTHFATRLGANMDRVSVDDYESGSRAAAAGGVTSFINFAFQEKGKSLRHAVEREMAKAEGKAHVDYGLHIGITDADVPGVLEELGPLADEGFASVKVLMSVVVPGWTMPDAKLLMVLEAAAHERILVSVHAEDDALVRHLSSRLIESGARGVRYLPKGRPPESEELATARIITYGRLLGCPIYVVHLSCRRALDAVRKARSEGAEVYVETRPIYLYLDDSCYELSGTEGNRFVCFPPLRSKEDRQALWDGLRSGEIQTYATDHNAWLLAQKENPELAFPDIPAGLPNVQTMLGMLFAEGVLKGRISLNQLVAVSSTNPAKLFGMWPKKGTIAIGADADMVFLDPEARVTITADRMESQSDYDPFDATEIVGWPVMTMSRGEVVFRDGQVTSRPGRGRLLQRSRYHPL